MRIKIVFFTFLVFNTSNLFAVDLFIGIKYTDATIEVNDERDEDKIIATLSSQSSPSIYINIRTEPKYFSKGKSNFGYFFKSDWSVFSLTQNKNEYIDENLNLNTHLKGYSIFSVPTIYYHFNRGVYRLDS